MFIRKTVYTIIALLLFVYSFPVNSSYSNELAVLGWNTTIKELKQNIDSLDRIDENLDNEFKKLNTDYKLKTFLIRDLSVVDLNKIRKIVSEYNENKTKIERELYKKAKNFEWVIDEQKQLLEEKRKLYSWLIPYINISFKEDYLEYIKWDAQIFHKQKGIKTDIITKQEILENKVENIETKIKAHKDFINENIKKLIELRLAEKIGNLSNNESFANLSDKSKVKVLEKTISKIKKKTEKLEESRQTSFSWSLLAPSLNILNKKIQTYYIALEKLEEFKSTFK